MLESDLIQEVQAIFSRGIDSDLLVPNGDDGAVFVSDKQIVVSADVCVSGVHFNEEWSTPLEIGRKVTAANLADICAMGGWPKYLIATLVLPNEKGVLELARGIAEEADRVGARVIGGDLSTGSELAISITAIGETLQPIRRSGAKVGDHVYVSNLPGSSAAGLYILKSGLKPSSELERELVSKHKAPTIDYAKYKNAFPLASAAIDISDGLLMDAARIAKASNVKINFDKEVLANSQLREFDGARYLDWVMRGGEDHVLLCTSPSVIPGFIDIGSVTAGSGIELNGEEIEIGGYSHQWPSG